ncbi:glycoside hydrolase family 43 protein [Butyrivibrio proteoclasticus]|uniref:glycoside hydrolase family 43 protein n=1 Tax=Butyrivibrio proteoclasticus TaxID=43305 RepID=UPI0006859CE6|nr:glycoside hydrolase family 43 protein [Butyrivibrio proteoclasticus]
MSKKTDVIENGAAFPYSIRDVHISDPFILADEKSGFYYTYVQFVDTTRFPEAKCDEACFYVLKSKDLLNWSEPKVCFKKGNFWADKDYWAPECHIWKGKYYIISSFRAEGKYRGCQCLVADNPEGPFVPVGEGPVTPKGWHCLDGTLYVDEEGNPWMVFCHEWMQVYDGQICAVRLNDDLSEAISEPIILFRASDAPWRGNNAADGGLITDGPFLYRMENGSLIMLWSSFSERGGYTVGYARSATGSIQGPWIQEPIPLYALDGGHAMLFRTFEGKLMMSLHCPNIHEKKRILLFEMEEMGDKLAIINEITGNWYNNAGGAAERWRYNEPLEQ